MDEEKQLTEEVEVVEEYEEYEEVTGPSGLSLALNRWFHHLDRGGSLGGEIMAGIGVFFLSICVIFMNMQIVGNVMTADVVLNSSPMSPVNIAAAKVYTQLYAGSILVAIIGSLLMGIVARLPFTQVSSMGFASSLLCLVGTQSGLTWQNLLFLNLIAAVVYAVVCGVPKVRSFLFDAIPSDIRWALPGALGLMVAWYALQMTGLVTTTTVSVGESQGLTLISGVAFSGMRKLALCGVIGGAVAVVLFAVLCLTKRKHRAFWPMLAGTAVFLVSSIVMDGLDTAKTESVMNFGRLWLVAGSQASQQTPFADSYLTYAADAIKAVFASFGQVITVGSDFSAYSGNTLALMVGAVLCYVFSGLFQAQGALLGAQDDLNANTEEESAKLDFARESGARTALLCCAASNILAPFFGVAGVNFGACSVSGAKDKGKSGIASIAACIGFVISLFVMAFPALFATVTHPVSSMNEWNYFAYGNGGIIYLIRGTVFGVADAVLMCVGVSMAGALKHVNWKQASGAVSAVLTVAGAVLTMNLVAGVLLGCAAYVLIQLFCDRKAITPGTVVMTLLMAATMALL